MKPLKFFVITDTHYFKNSLGAYGEAYEDFMDFEQKCFAETQAINEAVFDYLSNSDEADIVLICGDLSFNGEKESHLEFEEKLLRKLKNSGKDIYVVTAGHDIEPNPFAYDGGERIYVEGIKFFDLYDIYKDYGYDRAIAFYKEKLSYVAQLSDGVRLLVLCNDTEEKRNTEYSDELLNWAKEQAQKAKAESQLMIAMEHYPVLAGQPILTLVPDARQKGSRKLIDTLADNGVQLIFTGHMHNQSINVTKSSNGNLFYDVCTGSVIGCPAFMRLVTVHDEKTVEIKSIPVPEFCWDKKNLTGEEYLKAQFERMIRTVINGMQDDPARILKKFGAGDKKNLYGIVSKVGGFLSSCTVGKLARLLLVKCDREIKDKKFIDLAVDMVRNMFEGDQPFVEGTPEGDTVLRVFKRLKPVFAILNKKLHGAQGEQLDFYDMLKNTLGNYGISDNNAVIRLDCLN